MNKIISVTTIAKYFVQCQQKTCLQRFPQHCILQRSISTTNTFNSIKSKWVMPHFQELKRRHDNMMEKGLIPVERRSTFVEWNLDAELYAFGKRLNEEFDRPLLLKALMDRSHLVHQEQQQRALGIDPALTHQADDYKLTSSVDDQCNEELAAEGRVLVKESCRQFVSLAWPALPAEAIQSIVQHLTTDTTLALVAQGMGLKDLIFVEPFPPTEACMSRAACAVIAVLSRTSGRDRANVFVVDMVATHLVGNTLWDMWQIDDPLEVLSRILSTEGDSVEARLVHSAGRNTLEAVYHVALYDQHKTFVAKGYGETVETATSEAARDALLRLFGASPSSAPLPFTPSLPPSFATLPHSAPHPKGATVNPMLKDWSKDSADPRCGNIVIC